MKPESRAPRAEADRYRQTAQSGGCTTGQPAVVVASTWVAGPDELSVASLPSAIALSAGDANCSAAQNKTRDRTNVVRLMRRSINEGGGRREKGVSNHFHNFTLTHYVARFPPFISIKYISLTISIVLFHEAESFT